MSGQGRSAVDVSQSIALLGGFEKLSRKFACAQANSRINNPKEWCVCQRFGYLEHVRSRTYVAELESAALLELQFAGRFDDREAILAGRPWDRDGFGVDPASRASKMRPFKIANFFKSFPSISSP